MASGSWPQRGSVALRMLSDKLGLTTELSQAMAQPNSFPTHDRGRVLADVAVMLAPELAHLFSA